MVAMSKLSQDNEADRMSMRNSLLVWVFGAVLGWVVAVVAVYSVIRDNEDHVIAQDKISVPEHLNTIEPAAGETRD